MQVYIELVLLENFCMDFTLLYAAKIVSKNPSPAWQIVLAAVTGAVFAAVFPLFKLVSIWAVIVKIASGILICILAGRFKGLKSFLKFCGAFTCFTAILGGALIAVFSLTGTEYSAGKGYILSSVPVGIPLFCAMIAIVGARKIAKKFSKGNRVEVQCKISVGDKTAEIAGFFDSGNKVYKNGVPVSVVPENIANKLVDQTRINGGVKIHTVAGSKIIKIFTADRLEINFRDKTEIIRGARLGISPARIDRAVLHPDLLED